MLQQVVEAAAAPAQGSAVDGLFLRTPLKSSRRATLRASVVLFPEPRTASKSSEETESTPLPNPLQMRTRSRSLEETWVSSSSHSDLTRSRSQSNSSEETGSRRTSSEEIGSRSGSRSFPRFATRRGDGAALQSPQIPVGTSLDFSIAKNILHDRTTSPMRSPTRLARLSTDAKQPSLPLVLPRSKSTPAFRARPTEWKFNNINSPSHHTGRLVTPPEISPHWTSNSPLFRKPADEFIFSVVALPPAATTPKTGGRMSSTMRPRLMNSLVPPPSPRGPSPPPLALPSPPPRPPLITSPSATSWSSHTMVAWAR